MRNPHARTATAVGVLVSLGTIAALAVTAWSETAERAGAAGPTSTAAPSPELNPAAADSSSATGDRPAAIAPPAAAEEVLAQARRLHDFAAAVEADRQARFIDALAAAEEARKAEELARFADAVARAEAAAAAGYARGGIGIPPDSYWDRMAACETGGNWSMTGPRYSGGVGFYNGVRAPGRAGQPGAADHRGQPGRHPGLPGAAGIRGSCRLFGLGLHRLRRLPLKPWGRGYRGTAPSPAPEPALTGRHRLAR